MPDQAQGSDELLQRLLALIEDTGSSGGSPEAIQELMQLFAQYMTQEAQRNPMQQHVNALSDVASRDRFGGQVTDPGELTWDQSEARIRAQRQAASHGRNLMRAISVDPLDIRNAPPLAAGQDPTDYQAQQLGIDKKDMTAHLRRREYLGSRERVAQRRRDAAAPARARVAEKKRKAEEEAARLKAEEEARQKAEETAKFFSDVTGETARIAKERAVDGLIDENRVPGTRNGKREMRPLFGPDGSPYSEERTRSTVPGQKAAELEFHKRNELRETERILAAERERLAREARKKKEEEERERQLRWQQVTQNFLAQPPGPYNLGPRLPMGGMDANF